MRILGLMMLLLSVGMMPLAAQPTPVEVPMPADIPPHSTRFIAGEHHYDISNKPEMVHHLNSHYYSYGHHNYDLSGDPSFRHVYHRDDVHYRGMGTGEYERWGIQEKSFCQFPGEPEIPWVLKKMTRRRHRRNNDPDQSGVFPRPSWWVSYAGKKRVVLPWSPP
jgi:hypothetical protein